MSTVMSGAAGDPRAHVDPAQIAAAVGITADTGEGFQFTDAYGVTYTGVPAHLALSALARRDLTGGLYPDSPAVATGIRSSARTLIEWFTSPHADPGHVAEFAARSPRSVCDMVVYLCAYGDATALGQVGAESLRYYTEHLLHDPWPSLDHPLPRLVDRPYRSLAGPDYVPGMGLQVTATAADGADEVAVPMDIQASERISWSFTAPVRVPVDELNELLMDPADYLDDYLRERREAIEEYLGYSDSRSDEAISVSAELASPDGATVDVEPTRPMSVTLFFAGPDRETALQKAPFGSRQLAEQAADAGERVFSTTVDFDARAVTELP